MKVNISKDPFKHLVPNIVGNIIDYSSLDEEEEKRENEAKKKKRKVEEKKEERKKK